VAADPAYFDRYARMLGVSNFSNVNLDPDLPSVARVALDLYELQTGDVLDGMVLLDPLGLQRLLEATGDRLPVPERVGELLDIEGDLATADFARLVTVDVYATLGEARGDDRREACGCSVTRPSRGWPPGGGSRPRWRGRWSTPASNGICRSSARSRRSRTRSARSRSAGRCRGTGTGTCSR
jgi:hypothetical protein